MSYDRIYMPTDVAVSIVNDTEHLTMTPEAIPVALAAMCGRDQLACPTEMVATWSVAADKLRDQHHWLINVKPPRGLFETWGMVAVWAWMDQLVQRYGSLVMTTPIDPSEVPYCVHHNPFIR